MGLSPAARLFLDSAMRSLRAASRSRRCDSPERTAAPRGWRPGGETVESRLRAPAAPQAEQAALVTPAATSSSNRFPHFPHSNS